MRFGIAVGICVSLFAAATASATDIRDIVGVAHYSGRYWCPSNPQCAALGWAGDSVGSPDPNNIYPLHADGTRDYSSYTHDQLSDGADDILNLGSRVIYLKLNSVSPSFYPYTWPHDVTVADTHAAAGCSPWPCGRLVDMAKKTPYARLWSKGFTAYVMSIGPNIRIYNVGGGENYPRYGAALGYSDYGAGWGPVLDGLNASEKQDEKEEIRALASYFLSNPNGAFTGKTFIIANEEGDWQMRTGMVPLDDPTLVPSATRIQAMRDWINARQEGVTAARQAYPSSSVHVYNAAEVNRVDWAISGYTSFTNDVVPYTHCDLYSYSFWDSPPPHQTQDLIDRLNYLKTKAPDSPTTFGHYNILLAEYGSPINDTAGDLNAQSTTVQRLTEAAIGWGCPYVLYWQIWDNELSSGIRDTFPYSQRPTEAQTAGESLINPDGVHPPMYNALYNILRKSALRMGMRTYYNYYVSPQGDGGGAIYVNAPWLREWEHLTILGPTMGGPFTGEGVNLLTHNGYFVKALNGGGSGTDATSTAAGAWEQFTLLKQNAGGSAVVNGDTIALQSWNGYYAVAEGGGGSSNGTPYPLNANRTAIGPWEQFGVVATEPCSYSVSPLTINAGAGGGQFVVSVYTSDGCNWNVVNPTTWVTSSVAYQGIWLGTRSGNDTTTLTVAANSGGARSGTVIVAGQVVTVNQ